MDFIGIFSLLESNGDEEAARKASAYVRGQFQFLGIAAPKRRNLWRDFLRNTKKEKVIDWFFIEICWEKPYREYQYLALEYLDAMKAVLTPDDIPKIRHLAVTKSWWDTIDGLDRIAGHIAQNFPEVNDVLLQWSVEENIWLRRVAIDHQLLRKEKTDTRLLAKIIENNLGQSEFFINKAIGWSLRDYSKTNPDWVRNFIEKHRDGLAPLSIREASKYLQPKKA